MLTRGTPHRVGPRGSLDVPGDFKLPREREFTSELTNHFDTGYSVG